MNKLILFADDLTGSFDTGVQFAKAGIPTLVAGLDADLQALAPECSVLVIDTDSRHTDEQTAYRRLRELAEKAAGAGFDALYKKTDSCMRGNIGPELAGAMDGWGSSSLYYIPAYPQSGRITKGGIQYVEGVPVAESSFGRDALNPVQCSDIRGIIQSRVNILAQSFCRADAQTLGKPGISIFDACTEEDLKAAAEALKDDEGRFCVGGCAGFAAYYKDILDLPRRPEQQSPGAERLLVLCGSRHRVSAEQLAAAKKAGAAQVDLMQMPVTEELIGRLKEQLQTHAMVLVSTAGMTGDGDLSVRIPVLLGAIAAGLRDLPGIAFSVCGGDCFRGAADALGTELFLPVSEPDKGSALSVGRTAQGSVLLLSKAGGLGSPDAFLLQARALGIDI